MSFVCRCPGNKIMTSDQACVCPDNLVPDASNANNCICVNPDQSLENNICKCPGNKIPNSNNTKCECPAGFMDDASGKCKCEIQNQIAFGSYCYCPPQSTLNCNRCVCD